tara:strand:+ start:12386 stop:13300 length:915 start_codon:yes stop_codon:yes gene_type:complete
MALNITSTYAGEFAGKYIAAALLSSNTIEKGGVEVKPNIKLKEVIKKVATSGLIANASCDFTNAGDVTLTERIIQPEEFQVNLELCKTPFVSDWEAAQMGYSAFENMPPKFSDFLIGHISAEIAAKNETNIWVGVNSNAGEYDGLVTLAKADSDVSDITGTTVTSSNVIAEMGKVVDACPNAIYGKEDLHLYVSKNVAKAYVRALAAQGGGYENRVNMWYNMDTPLTFDGVSIFLANGLSNNQMMLAQKSNLYFGTGILNDMNLVKTLDMADLDGSQNFRFICRYTAGVQYGIGSEIVLYDPTV